MSIVRPDPQTAKAAAERLTADGLKFLDGGKPDAARRAYRQAVAAQPGSVAALGNLANLDARSSSQVRSCLGYRRALAFAPRSAGLHLMLGTALLKAGEDAAGEGALATALELAPGHPTAHLNLGTYMFQRRRMAEAERHFRQALKGAPALEPALVGLGRVLSQSARLREARAAAHRSVALGPASTEALGLLGQVHMATGDMAVATAALGRALAVVPDQVALKSLMLTAHYDPDMSSPRLFELHRRWAALQAAPARGHANLPDPERKLKVGYLTADFHDGHPVARNVVGLIEHHDPAAIEVHVYAGDGVGDAVTERIRAASKTWLSTAGLDGGAVAEMIRGDGIDVLVVLAGHTPFNRMAIAALKPAPVQVSMHDYTTSGLEQMDGFLSDPVLSPEGGGELFTETVFRLPCFYLHMPIEDVPVRPVSTGSLTLGSCNNPVKLNDRVIELWARALAAVPDAHLRLKYLDSFSDPDLVGDLTRRFKAQGIDPSRLAFDGRRTDREGHLEAVGGVDIALDTFPFNGSTTTYEALWMGVPVVTLTGDRFVGRVAASMLHQVGLGDLATATAEGFVQAVTGLAQDPGRRARLRGELRARLRSSPLLDPAAHARAVDGAYRSLWRSWCGKQN